MLVFGTTDAFLGSEVAGRSSTTTLRVRVASDADVFGDVAGDKAVKAAVAISVIVTGNAGVGFDGTGETSSAIALPYAVYTSVLMGVAHSASTAVRGVDSTFHALTKSDVASRGSTRAIRIEETFRLYANVCLVTDDFQGVLHAIVVSLALANAGWRIQGGVAVRSGSRAVRVLPTERFNALTEISSTRSDNANHGLVKVITIRITRAISNTLRRISRKVTNRSIRRTIYVFQAIRCSANVVSTDPFAIEERSESRAFVVVRATSAAGGNNIRSKVTHGQQGISAVRVFETFRRDASLGRAIAPHGSESAIGKTNYTFGVLLAVEVRSAGGSASRLAESIIRDHADREKRIRTIPVANALGPHTSSIEAPSLISPREVSTLVVVVASSEAGTGFNNSGVEGEFVQGSGKTDGHFRGTLAIFGTARANAATRGTVSIVSETSAVVLVIAHGLTGGSSSGSRVNTSRKQGVRAIAILHTFGNYAGTAVRETYSRIAPDPSFLNTNPMLGILEGDRLSLGPVVRMETRTICVRSATDFANS